MNVSVEELRVIIAALRFCLANHNNPLVKAEVFRDDQEMMDAMETLAELKHALRTALDRMPHVRVEVEADAE